MEKIISFNGTKIFYEITGSGFPVVLLHGFCEDNTSWNEWKKPFEEKFTLITPDLFGFGKSEIPQEKTTMKLFAEQLKFILEEEKISKFILIGHSMGGYISMQFAKLFSEKLSGLCLFHSSALADDEAKKAGRKKSIDFISRNGSEHFVKELYDGLFYEDFKNQNQKFLAELLNYGKTFSAQAIMNAQQAMMEREDTTEVLKNISVPLLFFIGMQDKNVLPEKIIPQTLFPKISQIEIYENVAHMGMFEQKEKTQNASLSFISLCSSIK